MRLPTLISISILSLVTSLASAREADAGRALIDSAGTELRTLASTGPLEQRVRALAALGRHADPADVGRLATADWSGAPHASRLVALVRARDPATYRPIFERLSRAQRPDLELLGCAGLLRLGVNAADPLLGAIRSRDLDGPLACDLAAEVGATVTVESLRERCDDHDEGTVPALGALGRLTSDPRERERCVRALRREALAARMPRRGGAEAAIEALGKIESRSAVDALVAAADSAATAARRDLAIRVLAERGIAGVAEKLLARIEQSGSLEAARALGAIPDRAFVPRLRVLLGHPEARIRDAAAVALARIGRFRDSAREIEACLADARASSRQDARLEIAEAMWEVGLPSVVGTASFEPALEIALPASFTRTESELARETIAGAVAAAGEASRIELTAPGTAMIGLRPGITRDELETVIAAVEEAGYAVSVAGSGAAPEPMGLSP
jgi:hypothetical protein